MSDKHPWLSRKLWTFVLSLAVCIAAAHFGAMNWPFVAAVTTLYGMYIGGNVGEWSQLAKILPEKHEK